MSKFSKLLKSPNAFVKDAVLNRFPNLKYKTYDALVSSSHDQSKPTAILIGFSDWKTWMKDTLPEYNVVFLGHSPRVDVALLEKIPQFRDPHVFVWSYKYPPELNEICKKNDISLTFVEDGFLRSVGLGIQKSRPMSLVFDKTAMHFDAQRPTDLDELLNTQNLSNRPDTADNVQKFKAAFCSGVSKYIRMESDENFSDAFQIDPDVEHIVVLGQVEDDLSIAYGADRFYSGNDLVQIAALENPDARILYRPHPEALARKKKHYSNPKDVSHLCEIIGSKWSLHETLEHASRVYTVTSFAGFEALLQGKQVDLFGLPFYGGWGFTNDRHGIDLSHKRRRTLTVDEVLAGALLLYPQYYHPITSETITAREAIDLASVLVTHMKRQNEVLAHRKSITASKEMAAF